jgi:serine phosphatase RsbU (regulator of sigma subunit)
MNSYKWEQAKHLYEAALKCPIGKRAQFLDENCNGDDELRNEVESLLSFSDNASSFLEKPAIGEVADIIVPENEKLELGVAMQSARLLGGGDYADAIALPSGSTLLCIADVAGKSVRAHARLPLLKYSLRALAPLHPEPAELVKKLNETLAPDLSAELYIAFCCVALDAEAGVLRWCNAGHIAPLLVHCREKDDCKTKPLEACGPPLGMFPEAEYSSREAKWRDGDHLLLFTDGLAEALSYNGTEDGEAQVTKLASRLAHESTRPADEVAQDFIALAKIALNAAETLPERLRAQLMALRPRPAGMPNMASHRDDITVVVARAKS